MIRAHYCFQFDRQLGPEAKIVADEFFESHQANCPVQKIQLHFNLGKNWWVD